MHSPGRHPSILEADPRASLLSGGRTCCFDLETSTASWLCNVQSQAWPAALGCPSAVMGPAYVFRRPERENSGRRGDLEEQQQPRNPLRSSRQVRQGGGLGGTSPARPAAILHTETLCARRGWEAMAPRFARLPSFLQGPDAWPEALPLGRCPISPLGCQTSHWGVGGEVFGGQITFACPSASEPPTALPGQWSSAVHAPASAQAPNQVLGIRASRGSFTSEGPEGK